MRRDAHLRSDDNPVVAESAGEGYSAASRSCHDEGTSWDDVPADSDNRTQPTASAARNDAMHHAASRVKPTSRR